MPGRLRSPPTRWSAWWRAGDIPEHRPVRRGDLLPTGDVGHEHAGADHVLEPPAERLERRADDLERAAGLLGDRRRVRPVGVDPDRAADGDHVPGAHGARVAEDRLPPGARAGRAAPAPLAHGDADVAHGSATMQMPHACGAPPMLWLSATVGFPFTCRFSAFPWSCL